MQIRFNDEHFLKRWKLFETNIVICSVFVDVPIVSARQEGVALDYREIAGCMLSVEISL